MEDVCKVVYQEAESILLRSIVGDRIVKQLGGIYRFMESRNPIPIPKITRRRNEFLSFSLSVSSESKWVIKRESLNGKNAE